MYQLAFGSIVNAPLRKKGQRGITLLEVTIGLIIAAVLGAAAYVGFQRNQRRSSIADNSKVITEIVTSAKQKFGSTNNYGALTTAIAVTSRTIPEDLRNAGANTAQNSFGGAITMAPVNLAGANDGVDLTWPNIPQDQCLDLVIGVERTARRISVEGVLVKPLDGALNIATLSTQCESAANVTAVFALGRN